MWGGIYYDVIEESKINVPDTLDYDEGPEVFNIVRIFIPRKKPNEIHLCGYIELEKYVGFPFYDDKVEGDIVLEFSKNTDFFSDPPSPDRMRDIIYNEPYEKIHFEEIKGV
jgi:hypothetical protein